ncbi:hypothetical protein [Catenuloplanes atrovinosus]|uniref:hypothetical protein n=1 Tax=Catenuloplanes atrovinosus TaxID=137266 RepID=UPI00286C5290|nr:hypothetical protein [Catenuloplanes atrovinosus]
MNPVLRRAELKRARQARAVSIGPDNLGNGSATQDRFAGHLNGYRPIQRDRVLSGEVGPDVELSPRTGALDEPPIDHGPRLPSLALAGLEEPVFPTTGWPDTTDPGPLADHPLLRGLLLELPPKGSLPEPGWLDRWFEAARAILELIYTQGALDRR